MVLYKKNIILFIVTAFILKSSSLFTMEQSAQIPVVGSVSTLEQICIDKIAQNINGYDDEEFSSLTPNLRLTILLKQLKSLNEDLEELNQQYAIFQEDDSDLGLYTGLPEESEEETFSDEDSDSIDSFELDDKIANLEENFSACSLEINTQIRVLENKIFTFARQAMGLLNSAMLSETQAATLVENLMGLLNGEYVCQLLEIWTRYKINDVNQSNIARAFIRYGFNNHLFNALCENIQCGTLEVDQIPDEFNVEDPSFTITAQGNNPQVFQLNNSDDVLEKEFKLNNWLLGSVSKQLVGYNAEKDIIVYPLYERGLLPGNSEITNTYMALILQEEFWLALSNIHNHIPFQDYREENPVVKVLLDGSISKVLLMTQNGKHLILELPSFITAFIHGELSLQETVFLVTVLELSNKAFPGDCIGDVTITQDTIDQLKDHEIIRSIAEKNYELFRSLCLVIDDLRYTFQAPANDEIEEIATG